VKAQILLQHNGDNGSAITAAGAICQTRRWERLRQNAHDCAEATSTYLTDIVRGQTAGD